MLIINVRNRFTWCNLKGAGDFSEYEWMMEEGADEKLQREVEEELKMAELERLMMQEEKDSGSVNKKV